MGFIIDYGMGWGGDWDGDGDGGWGESIPDVAFDYCAFAENA